MTRQQGVCLNPAAAHEQEGLTLQCSSVWPQAPSQSPCDFTGGAHLSRWQCHFRGADLCPEYLSRRAAEVDSWAVADTCMSQSEGGQNLLSL